MSCIYCGHPHAGDAPVRNHVRLQARVVHVLAVVGAHAHGRVRGGAGRVVAVRVRAAVGEARRVGQVQQLQGTKTEAPVDIDKRITVPTTTTAPN